MYFWIICFNNLKLKTNLLLLYASCTWMNLVAAYYSVPTILWIYLSFSCKSSKCGSHSFTSTLMHIAHPPATFVYYYRFDILAFLPWMLCNLLTYLLSPCQFFCRHNCITSILSWRKILALINVRIFFTNTQVLQRVYLFICTRFYLALTWL